jgi:hypothetical protein
VASTVIPDQTIPSNPRQSAIITRQEQLLTNNTTSNLTPNQTSTNINALANEFQLHPSFQSLLARFSTDPTQTMIAADNLNLSAPHTNIPPVTNFNSHIIITQPETENHQTTSLPNQTFIFNSQPTINAMSAISTDSPIHTLRKTPGPLTIQYQNKNNVDPKPTRPDPYNPRKQKNPPRSNPTQNPSESEKTQDEHHDMELQCDKKRRREDDSSSTTTTTSQSFLTAGPGRQDCRDQ